MTVRMEKQHKFNFFGLIGAGFLSEQWYHHGYANYGYRYRSGCFDAGRGIEIVPLRDFSFRTDLTDFHGGHLSRGDHLDLKLSAMFRF